MESDFYLATCFFSPDCEYGVRLSICSRAIVARAGANQGKREGTGKDLKQPMSRCLLIRTS